MHKIMLSDLRDFDCGMFIGARPGWFDYFWNRWYPGIFMSLEFTQNGPKNKKYPVSGSSADGNVLSMRG